MRAVTRSITGSLPRGASDRSPTLGPQMRPWRSRITAHHMNADVRDIIPDDTSPMPPQEMRNE